MDIIITCDKVGYDISVLEEDGGLITKAWSHTLQNAYYKASIFQGFYTDSEGNKIKITEKITSTE